MAQEIERKFLVLNDNYKTKAGKSFLIRQGYLSTHPERSVRVRIKEDRGFLTVKGAADAKGISRFEWEIEISVGEAEDLLTICEPGVIEKIRYEVKYKDYTFEVDDFLNNNKGLVIAELELSREDEAYSRPDWLGKEVTGEKKYYNSMLARIPYDTW
jgi:CYTH domain-containing protein